MLSGVFFPSSMVCSGPEPFIQPLVQSMRSEFQPPSRELYRRVREDIIHRFVALKQPLSLDVLPVTSVDFASVLPPVPVGSLTDFGRRLGLSEISAVERLKRGTHENRPTLPSEIPQRKKPQRPKTPLHLDLEILRTPKLNARASTSPTNLRDSPQRHPGPHLDPHLGPHLGPDQEPRTPAHVGLETSPSPPAHQRARKAAHNRNSLRNFSPEIFSPSSERRSLDNSSLVEIFPRELSRTSPGGVADREERPRTGETSGGRSDGVRVTLDLSVDAETSPAENFKEIEKLLVDAERLFQGERISESEITRELRLLDEISDSSGNFLRSSWSDIEAELDRLRRELDNSN